MKENATDAQCQALSEKLDYHGKLVCDNEKTKEIIAQFDDELDLLAFQVAIGAVTISTVKVPKDNIK